MVSENDMQRAHDILHAVLQHEIPGIIVPDEDEALLNVALDVLCWCLQHQNGAFAANMHRLEEVAERNGVVFERETVH